MPLSAPRVGIVDDDLSVRRALSRLLRSRDITVEVFASGAEFLERPEEPALSCVVIDLYMPGMDGLDLQQSLLARFRIGHRNHVRFGSKAAAQM